MKHLVIRLLIVTFCLNYSCSKKKRLNYYPSYLEDINTKHDLEDVFDTNDLIRDRFKVLMKNLKDTVPYFKIEDDSSINFVKLSFPKDGFYKSSSYL